MRKKPSSLYLRYSIWLTACAVIVLIILLALTVYNVRERAIIDLFCAQQSVIAHQNASRIEESIQRVEKDMVLLSKMVSSNFITQDEKRQRIQAFSDEHHDIVLFLVELDEHDRIVYGYPQDAATRLHGGTIDDHALHHALKKMHHTYTGILRFPEQRVADSDVLPRDTIGIGVPVFSGNATYDGAVVALLSLETIIPQFATSEQTFSNEIWLFDEYGKIVFHPDQDMIGTDLNTLSQIEHISARIFLYNPQHYSELTLSMNTRLVKYILAHGSFRIGTARWWFVLATPRSEILGPIRKASLNIILGAIGLIVVVLVTATSIARYDVKRLRLKEEFKRLKEREEWQGKLLREKMTIEGIIEGSPVPTFVLDKHHTVILWNHACTELTGYDSKEMIGTDKYYMPFYDSKRPVLADLIIDEDAQNFTTYYSEGKVKEFESIQGAYQAMEHFKNLNGKDRHLHFLAAPIYDEKGEIVAAIETFLDVTNEVELTRSLQEYAETLQSEVNENIRLREDMEELLNYLQSIIESLPDKIFDLSKDGVVKYVSKPRVNWRGNHAADGKHFSEFVAPEHRDFVTERWEDAQKGIFTPYELEVVTRKGEKRNLLITPGPVKGTDRYVLVQRDITELKELEKKYYESQKLAAIGQLSAGIAHEVRNPLSSIKMSLQILEKRLQPTGNDLKRFRIAEREVEHLEKLVNDVLIYARPSDPKKEPSHMPSIIEQALALVEKSFKDKAIQVLKEYPQDMEVICVDPSMIVQALINILQNAADAMDSGGELVISLKDENESVVMEIADNGCGIDEEDFPHLFNPFFSRKSYGTGLGLTQVRKIIDQHNGTIEVISTKDIGTRFVIILPKSTEVIREKGQKDAPFIGQDEKGQM
ncbi:MAG: ATP-binding protein [Desulfomonilia bacterium]